MLPSFGRVRAKKCVDFVQHFEIQAQKLKTLDFQYKLKCFGAFCVCVFYTLSCAICIPETLSAQENQRLEGLETRIK